MKIRPKTKEYIQSSMLEWIAAGNKLITFGNEYPFLVSPDAVIEACARELVLDGKISDKDLR